MICGRPIVFHSLETGIFLCGGCALSALSALNPPQWVKACALCALSLIYGRFDATMRSVGVRNEPTQAKRRPEGPPKIFLRVGWLGHFFLNLLQMSSPVWYLYRFNSGWFSLRFSDFVADPGVSAKNLPLP
jgi:hypothetical protein